MKAELKTLAEHSDAELMGLLEAAGEAIAVQMSRGLDATETWAFWRAVNAALSARN